MLGHIVNPNYLRGAFDNRIAGHRHGADGALMARLPRYHADEAFARNT